MNNLRRVVITGLGICSPLGMGTKRVWEKLISGESGISSIDSLSNASEFKNIPSRVVGLVPRGTGEGFFSEGDWIAKWERKTMNLATIYAISSAADSLLDAGLVTSLVTSDNQNSSQPNKTPKTYKLKDVNPDKIGISLGVGMVDMEDIYEQCAILHTSGPRRVSPYFIPRNLINMAASHVSMRFGLKGPCQAQSTACTTGLHSIGDAAWMVSRGSADVMVAGGTEAPIYPMGLAGFSQAKALSTKFNDSPTKASRPFNKDRDGFVMSEGSAVAVVESLDHALKRGVTTIYGEILGYGMSCDAHHLTAPSSDGAGATSCMRAALEDGNLDPGQVAHINAHATSTPLGDSVENMAIKKVFTDRASSLLISATKSSTGHLLGAAGSLEAAFTTLAVHHGVAPPLSLIHI